MNNVMKIQYLTPKQAAEVLQISERTLYKLTKFAGLPGLKIGRLVRYDPEDLAAWIAKRKMQN